MKNLKFGLIGYSEGNGHPYSWAAIFNGHNSKALANCPFPVIRNYLSQQQSTKGVIPNVQVTHVWTPNKKVSEAIAKVSNIPNIVSSYENMLGKVDAILVPRDDHENHHEISKFFIKAGLPIYIDKPLAIKKEIAQQLFDLEQYDGQIFSCSAIGYSKEFKLSEKERNYLGKLEYIDACIIKDWERYSGHIIEPVLKIIGNQGKITKTNTSVIENNKIVSIGWESGLVTNFTSFGKRIPAPITIRIYGEKGYKELIYEDHFYATKKTMLLFIDIILKKENPISKDFTLKIIDIIERGSTDEKQMHINNGRNRENWLSAS